MYLLRIASTSFASIIVLFLLTKIMGNKQISQFNMFDYINSITIGSIAAEMATDEVPDFFDPLIAMVVYTVVVVIIAYLTNKSLAMRRFFTGKSLILYNNGTLYRQNFAKSKLDINEFLMECRLAGYFDLSQIQTAIIEENGKISFLPKAGDRPATPTDLNLSPKQDKVLYSLILDGEILYKNLSAIGKDENWLKKQLSLNKTKNIEEIFLAVCDEYDNFTVYKANNEDNKKDIFQ